MSFAALLTLNASYITANHASEVVQYRQPPAAFADLAAKVRRLEPKHAADTLIDSLQLWASKADLASVGLALDEVQLTPLGEIYRVMQLLHEGPGHWYVWAVVTEEATFQRRNVDYDLTTGVESNETFNPNQPVTVTPPFPFRVEEYGSDAIRHGDHQVLIPGTELATDPQPQDLLIRGGETLKVVWVEKFYSGTTPTGWRVGVRN